jgi:hypothetical protein
MRSSISNFKERLRLPRLFFRKPSREEQIHGGPPLEFERPIPPAPWRGIAVVSLSSSSLRPTAWDCTAARLVMRRRSMTTKIFGQ